MKIYNKNSRKTTLLIMTAAMIISAGLIMSSCKKPGDTFEQFDASNLRVVNGLTDRTNVKFYLDTFNLTYTGTVNFTGVTQYFVVKSGSRNAAFYSTTTKDTFARRPIQLDVKKTYTLFLAGSAASPKSIYTEDDLTEPAADKAKVRFANLALTGGNVDLTIQLEDLVSAPQPKPEVVVFTNVAPQSVSNYATITVPTSKGNAIIQRHTIRIYAAGTNTLLASLGSVDLRGTSTNTLISTGVSGGSPAMAIRSNLEWLDW